MFPIGGGLEAVAARRSERNQILLPKAAREALGIKPGERALVVTSGAEVRPRYGDVHLRFPNLAMHDVDAAVVERMA